MLQPLQICLVLPICMVWSKLNPSFTLATIARFLPLNHAVTHIKLTL